MVPTNIMKGKNLYIYIKALAVVGLLLSLYLLWQQLARPAFRPCSINDFINCDAVISGPVAKTFGIPTPLYGLIGYIVIFIAATLKKTKVLLGMAAFGVVFCLWIAYVELFQLKVICPVCIGCQIVMISILALAVGLEKRKPRANKA